MPGYIVPFSAKNYLHKVTKQWMMDDTSGNYLVPLLKHGHLEQLD